MKASLQDDWNRAEKKLMKQQFMYSFTQIKSHNKSIRNTHNVINSSLDLISE